jgi:hypothetical protein
MKFFFYKLALELNLALINSLGEPPNANKGIKMLFFQITFYAFSPWPSE